MLEKVALVLGAFTGGTPLSLAELGRRTGLARSSVHRLVTDLAELDWVQRIDNRYELGMALFELGELVPIKHRLRTVALPFMQDLFAATGETVHLAVRDGVDALYAEKIHGHHSLPLPSRTGGRAPLTCTAVGKAILAHEAADVLQDVLDRPLRRWTPASVVDRDVLVRQLDEVRRTGIALEREEAAVGGACIAAPVLVSGRPVAALSVAVPIDRFTPERLGPAVRTAALGLARTLHRGEMTASRAGTGDPS
jgi:DNA-binding IclR family transcriptional regulator